ncbi:acetate--CoA ligase family protein [Microbacterium soli]|uniref:Acetate--CoA ligase family protein n=1 Tax=Microbacterium soli TaxID=446075 RepID=A0ABP7N9U2_9MICO
MSLQETERPSLDLRSLLAPRSIAVVGASADQGRHNGRPIANLLRTGYDGRIYPVTPREGDVRGLSSFRTVLQVPEQVDLAIVLVRADRVLGVLRECAEAGVRNVVVNASGFAEEGEEGRRAQEEIRSIARQSGMRVIGPNCIGVLSVTDGVLPVTTLNVTVEQTPGDVAIVSQSGGMAANIFNRAQADGVGVRAALSLGNEADVDVADAVAALADDAATETILMYVEQLRDIPRFRRAMARVRAAGKAVLCVKAGRSDAGMRSAQSHTGAMAGAFAVFRDLVEGMGVRVLDGLDEMIDTARIRQRFGSVAGRRVLVVSPSGGECGYVADLAEESGLILPELSEGLGQRLGELMRFGAPSNPLDLTGQVIGDDALLDGVFHAIADGPEFDAVVVALPTWGDFDSQRLMPRITAAVQALEIPAVVTAWSSHGLTEWRDGYLRSSPLLAFDSPGRAVRALAFAASLDGVGAASESAARVLSPVHWDAEAVRDEASAKRWLHGLGVPVSEELVLPLGESEAPPFGYPVVVKGVAPGVAHKSELGLVEADVRDERDFKRAVARIRQSATVHAVDLAGMLVARRYAGVELIAGITRDRAFGPVMMVGAGGVLAELLDDTAFLACPASPAQVRSTLERLRITRLLSGFRGGRADVDALVALLVRVSEVAAGCPELGELDLNPIIVGEPGEGAVVVDALVRYRRDDRE